MIVRILLVLSCAGQFVLKGDLDISVRTASKYNESKLLHLPNLRFWWVEKKFDWEKTFKHTVNMMCAAENATYFNVCVCVCVRVRACVCVCMRVCMFSVTERTRLGNYKAHYEHMWLHCEYKMICYE